MNARNRSALLPVAWGLALLNVASLPTTFLYFFPAPMVLQTLVTALLLAGCVIETLRRKQSQEAPA
jgi:hypothetical protein